MEVVSSAVESIANALLVPCLLRRRRTSLAAEELAKAVGNLKEEMEMIHDSQRDYALVKAPDVRVREGMKQLREIGYDIEDFIDLFEHEEAKHKSSPSSLKPRHNPTRSRSSALGRIRRLRRLLKEAKERHKCYGIDRVLSSAVHGGADAGLESVISATVDGELIRVLQPDAYVAMEVPTKELHKFLAVTADEKHTKVASIVGMAGIGKTALALHAYTTLPEPFHSRAFVYVGRRPSMMTVLLSIISQVTQEQERGYIADVHEAIDALRDILRDKRYLMIFDDIWSTSAWKAINDALPQNNLGSRIIVTTRIRDVAGLCSNHPSDLTYEMKTLGDEDVIKLFHSRIVGPGEKCLEEHCKEVHDMVLQKCDGLPYATIIVASILARRRKPGEWKMVLSPSVPYSPRSESIIDILHLSYSDLPYPIKCCFLYLTVFPKNHEIKKDRLIRRWMAEGFIGPGKGRYMWKRGSRYFNELINRCLIQPVFSGDDDDGNADADGIVGCKVHGAIHDFIVSLSSQENFVTLDEALESGPRDVVRRLSLNYTEQDERGTRTRLALDLDRRNLKKVRSLTVLDPAEPFSSLASFLLLRVLDLEDTEGLKKGCLKDIGKLFNLRYLGLGGNSVTELPDAIGELQHLETLEIRRTKVRVLPPAAAKLQKLVYILSKALDATPDVIEKMKCLKELSMVNVSNSRSLQLLEDLGMLEELRILGLRWCFSEGQTDGGIESYRKDFISYLNELSESRITSLFIYSDGACKLDFLADPSWAPPSQLHKLVLKCPGTFYLPGTPKGLTNCLFLDYLEIALDLDREENGLKIIAELPNLITFKLSAAGRDPITIESGFRRLGLFWFQHQDGFLGLKFREGAMPYLQKLHIRFKLQHGHFSCGLRHLVSLKHLHATLDCHGATAKEVKSAEDEIKKAAFKHHGNITLVLKRDNVEKIIFREEGQGSGSNQPEASH